MSKHVKIGNFEVGNDLPIVILAGPCQIETKDHAFDMAGALKELTGKLGMGFVYKSSFDKANRSSIETKRGLGIDEGLAILQAVNKEIGCPTLTDVHLPEQCPEAAEVVDVLQIPAFLCRQTDLVVAAAQTGKPLNIKKGQFMAPWDMANIAGKAADTGNDNIMLCERGASFGYNMLVTDIRSLPIMAQTGYPVVMDATHSVMKPGGAGNKSGGDRTMVPYIARAAVAAGAAAVFIETHQDPDNAPSDGPNMVYLKDMEALLTSLLEIDQLVKPRLKAAA